MPQNMYTFGLFWLLNVCNGLMHFKFITKTVKNINLIPSGENSWSTSGKVYRMLISNWSVTFVTK